MGILRIIEETGPSRPFQQFLTSRELEVVGWLRDGLPNRYRLGTYRVYAVNIGASRDSVLLGSADYRRCAGKSVLSAPALT
jgi:hypothetical protein